MTGGVEREIQVLVDPSRLAHYGLTLEQLGQLLRMENLNVSAGRLVEGAREIQVRSLGEIEGPAELENLVLRKNSAGTLYLRDVAQVRDGFTEELQLTRLNGKPGLSVALHKQSGANTVRVSAAVNEALAELEEVLPPGAGIGVIFDQAEFINQSVGNMLNMGLSGGFLALLAGIVVNNAIVLVDYINTLRARGHSCREAILLAGPVRLRPILMTTLTTVLGMFPMALGIGAGAETQAPLATAVIGGLSVSTLLTLLVVPVIYSIMEDLAQRLRQRRQKMVMGEAGL